jgi:hypothetical protein
MKRHWKIDNGWAAWTIGLAIFCGACSTEPVPPQPVTHIVLIWLKHPESAYDRAQLVRAAHSLQMMPGVSRVDTGRTASGLGPEVDRSFDLAVMIMFRDRSALDRYEGDARHRATMDRFLQPLVRHYETYNLGVR